MTCRGPHWFAYPRQVGTSSPTCTRLYCEAPNPRYRPDDDPYPCTCTHEYTGLDYFIRERDPNCPKHGSRA